MPKIACIIAHVGKIPRATAPAGVVVGVNPSLGALFGFLPEALLNVSFIGLVHPDDASGVRGC